jgi:hypothetical protein
MDVAAFAVFPGPQHFLGAPGDNPRIQRKPFAMKCRLAQPALPQPLAAFTCQQTLTEKPAAVLDNAILPEILLIGDQNGFDELRRIQKIDVNPPGAIVKDIAEFPRPAGKNSQRVSPPKGKIPNKKMRPGARRAANGRIGHFSCN